MNPLLLNRFQLRAPFLSPEGDGGGGGGSSDGNANAGGNQGGSEGNQGDSKGKEAGQESSKAEAVTVVLEGKTYLLQDHANKLIGDARKDGKTAGANEAKRQAEEAAAREKGDLETVTRTQAERIVELEGEIAKRDRQSLRDAVAAKHGLVGEHADLAEFITGETEEEMTAKAKTLAARVLPKKAADTEAGKRNGATGKRNEERKSAAASTNYSWMPAGAVTIPD